MTIKANEQLVAMVKKAAIGSIARNIGNKNLLALGAGGAAGAGIYAASRNKKPESTLSKIKNKASDLGSSAAEGINKRLEGFSPLATAGIGLGGGVGLYLLAKYMMGRRNRQSRSRYF